MESQMPEQRRLIIDRTDQIYDRQSIQPGALLYARHRTWEAGRAGFVTLVSDSEIQVQYYPGVRGVTNYFRLPASEVAAGEWDVRWSSDLKQIGEILKKEGGGG